MLGEALRALRVYPPLTVLMPSVSWIWLRHHEDLALLLLAFFRPLPQPSENR